MLIAEKKREDQTAPELVGLHGLAEIAGDFGHGRNVVGEAGTKPAGGELGSITAVSYGDGLSEH